MYLSVMWTVIDSLDTSILTDDDLFASPVSCNLAVFLVSFMNLVLWQNVEKHTNIHYFVSLSAVDAYIPGVLMLMKNFYREIKSVMDINSDRHTSNKHKRKYEEEWADIIHNDQQSYTDLIVQLDWDTARTHDTLDNGDRVVNLHVLVAYIRSRYERLLRHCTRIDVHYGITSLIKACQWKKNVITPARIIFLHDKQIMDTTVTWPTTESQATEILTNWILVHHNNNQHVVSKDLESSDCTYPKKKKQCHDPFLLRLQSIIDDVTMSGISSTQQLSVFNQMQSLIESSKPSDLSITSSQQDTVNVKSTIANRDSSITSFEPLPGNVKSTQERRPISIRERVESFINNSCMHDVTSRRECTSNSTMVSLPPLTTHKPSATGTNASPVHILVPRRRNKVEATKPVLTDSTITSSVTTAVQVKSNLVIQPSSTPEHPSLEKPSIQPNTNNLHSISSTDHS